MPANKDLKRLVRSRMQKTGESYTTARAHLVSRPPDYATLAGMTDAKVAAATGCDWHNWVYVLDKADAHRWPHREIAAWIREKYGTASWWSQMVTVGYERIKGLRVKGQRRGGGFDVNKSKTIGVPVGRLYRAWRDPRVRRQWLADAIAFRRATPNTLLRITWPDGTSVTAAFASKGRAKSVVSLQHEKLPDQAAADRVRAFWTSRLAALGELLTG